MPKKPSASAPAAREKRRRTVLIGAICAVAVTAIVVCVILFSGRADKPAETKAQPTAAALDESLLKGETMAVDPIVGSWVSYADGKKITYTFDDDGCAIYRSEDGSASEYHFEIQGDRFIQTSGEKRRVFIWSPVATGFVADHEYGEAADITARVREQIENFSGYMYVDGDYLWFGQLCLCAEEKLTGSDSDSLVGSWTGAAGDRVTLTADGAYHYRDMKLDYDGTYRIDEETGNLILHLDGTDDSVLVPGEWQVNGRVMHMRKRYYFRDTAE